jgi:hypothetical protein
MGYDIETLRCGTLPVQVHKTQKDLRLTTDPIFLRHNRSLPCDLFLALNHHRLVFTTALLSATNSLHPPNASLARRMRAHPAKLGRLPLMLWIDDSRLRPSA